MSHSNDKTSVSGSINARHSAQQLWSDGQDLRVATGCFGESLKKGSGGKSDPFRGMHAAAYWTDEGTFEMHSEDLCTIIFRLLL
jgi:hypothetical protein